MYCQFCPSCGAKRDVPNEAQPACAACGAHFPDGPAVLVIVGVFAGERLLMIRRGLEPYANTWAPPGGFLEHGEAVEIAAARELQEETGLVLPPSDFLVTGMVSLTALNQLHVVMHATLENAVPVEARPPETLEARWFAPDEFPKDVWDPYLALDSEFLFWPARNKSFRFVHQTDNARRVITTETSLQHPWRKG